MAYDAQTFNLQRTGGISRYFTELIRGIPKVDNAISVDFPSRWTLNEHAIAAGLAWPYPSSLDPKKWKRRGRVPSSVVREMHRWATKPRKVGNSDVIHPTYYSRRNSLGNQGSVPLVTTVVDMIPELHPDLFHGNPHQGKDWYIRNSAGLIAISESTARDVRDRYPSLHVPIHVIPLAVSSTDFHPTGSAMDSFPRPWALFVGNRGGYKDFDVLLRAAAMEGLSELTIVAVGGGACSSGEQDLIRRLNLSDRVVFVSATDAELPSFYRGADVFVFPSRYEGFGLPTLEAMSCGAPVVLPSTSSHPEVAGTAAQYFVAESAESLAEVLTLVLEDGELRAAMREAGLRRATEFSWSRTATETAAVYRSVVGEVET